MENLFFITSKLAWALLSPSNLLILLFSLGSLLLLINYRSAAKWVLLPSSAVALALTAYPLGDYLIQPLESRFHQPDVMPPSIDGIIVLGGAEDIVRSVSWSTPEVGQAAERFISAAKLAGIYPQSKIIYAGGNSSVQKQGMQFELDIERQIFAAMGINDARLIIEKKARNTYENFINIKPLLPQSVDGKLGTYLLVTSAFHMPRSVGIARKQGITVIPYPVDYRSADAEQRVLGLDFYDHLQALEPAWKEWIGLIVYFLTDKTSSFFPKPLPHDSALDIHPTNETHYNDKTQKPTALSKDEMGPHHPDAAPAKVPSK